MSSITGSSQSDFSDRHLKLRNRCFAFSLLIAALVYVFPLSGGNSQLLIIFQIVLVLWAGITFILKIKEMSLSNYGIVVWWFIGLVLVVNLWFNYENYDVVNESFKFAVAHVIGIIAFVFVAQWATNNLEPALIFEYIGWLLSPLILVAVVLYWTPWAVIRIVPFGIHPNWWGEMAFGFILCALAIRFIKIKVTFIISALVLMYAVQSRGALLSALVSIFTFCLLEFRPFGKIAMRRLKIAGIFIVSFIILILIMDWWTFIMTFFENKVLLLNDPYRGFGSNFTGRLIYWREALAIFEKNPIWGNGFDTLNFVHNGFLRIAAEGGIILFVLMISMIISSMVYAWRQKINIVFASLLGIVTYFMTYPRALNLNIVGIIFLLTLFRWKKKNCKSEGIQQVFCVR